MKPKKEDEGKVFKTVYVHDLADDYLQSAFDVIEEIKKLKYKSSLKRKVINSCILSFLSIEACINRIFFICFKPTAETQKNITANAPSKVVDYVISNWKRLSIKDKILVLPPLISNYEFDTSNKPFNLFNEFIQFRNQLIHAQSWEAEHSILLTHVNLDEKGRGTWGGKTLNIERLDNKSNGFKLTNFSKAFEDLKIDDAEKCLEIACWMRMELAKTKKVSQPVFNFDKPFKGINAITGPRIMNDVITRHFK
jgi:hypothetical protein